MHRAAVLRVGALLGERFEVVAGLPGPDVPRVRSDRAQALCAKDRTTGTRVLLEATATAVPPDFPVASLRWPRGPGLVTVLATGHDARSGAAYLARDAVQGVSASSLETPGDRLAPVANPDPQALHVARGALAALETLHVAGIRDGRLTAERLVITGDGEVLLLPPDEWAQWGGFSAAGEPAMNRTIAPECLEGGPAASTAATDVYTVAALLYRLLAGRPRVRARTRLELFQRLRSPADPLSDARPDLPAPLVAAVMRALEPDPGARWSSASDLARALS